MIVVALAHLMSAHAGNIVEALEGIVCAEKVFENLLRVSELVMMELCAPSAAPHVASPAPEPLLPILVIQLPLLLVTQNLVSLGDLLEFLLGSL